MKPAHKKERQQVLVFDETERKEYLTGFEKRNKKNKKMRELAKKEKERKERLAHRQALRESRKLDPAVRSKAFSEQTSNSKRNKLKESLKENETTDSQATYDFRDGDDAVSVIISETLE